MKKYPHGITLAAVCSAIDAFNKHEDDVPEIGILNAFEILLSDSDVGKKLQALAAENAILKSGIGFFSYGTDSGFEEHDSAEKAIAAADSDIDYYRGDACDGWSEETDCTVWGVIMQRATVTGLRAVTEDDNCDPSIKEWCDYTLLPNVETPATDAYLNSVRAEGIHFAANRMLTAWESGFIDDTPAQVLDISGAVLSALEFLPSASPEEFKRDYADEVRAAIVAQLRASNAGKDGVEKTITALPVERDEHGYWSHPDYLAFCGGREFIPAAEFDQWMSERGLQWKVEYRDEEEIDPNVDGYDLSTWPPEAPAGDGWFIGSIHDTEDGAVCIWLRAGKDGE